MPPFVTGEPRQLLLQTAQHRHSTPKQACEETNQPSLRLLVGIWLQPGSDIAASKHHGTPGTLVWQPLKLLSPLSLSVPCSPRSSLSSRSPLQHPPFTPAPLYTSAASAPWLPPPPRTPRGGGLAGPRAGDGGFRESTFTRVWSPPVSSCSTAFCWLGGTHARNTSSNGFCSLFCTHEGAKGRGGKGDKGGRE
jgi:hypothetical protein